MSSQIDPEKVFFYITLHNDVWARVLVNNDVNIAHCITHLVTKLFNVTLVGAAFRWALALWSIRVSVIRLNSCYL